MAAPTASRLLEERIAALECALDRLCPGWRQSSAGGGPSALADRHEARAARRRA